jgi:DNA-binding NarL/FixJ family response regulator
MHDHDLSLQFASLLEKAKFEVVKCGTARELQDLLSDNQPAAIVLGVLLPDANGLEICKRLKGETRSREIKIVMVSTFKRSARFALDAKNRFGADEYLEISASPKDLIKAVESLLGIGAARPPAAAEPADSAAGAAGGETPAPPSAGAGQERRDAGRVAAPPAPPAPSRPTPPRPVAESRFVEQPFKRSPDREPPEKTPPPNAGAPLGPAPPRGAGAGPAPAAPRPGATREAREIPLSGRLGTVLLPELLLSLYQRRVGGILEVRAYDEQREILVRDGVPIAIRSNFIPDDALGQLLIAQGSIDAIALERLLRQAKKEGRKIGDLLVETGVVSAGKLDALLRIQAKRKMNSAFRWKDGSYTFAPGAHDMPDGIDIHQDMLAILLGGVVRHFDMAKLEERLYENKYAVVVRTAKPEIEPKDLSMTERERGILELVDGERTLGAIIAESDLNFVRTFQVLYLFLLFGIVRFKDGDRFFRLDEAVAQRAQVESRSGSRAGRPEPEPAPETRRDDENAFPKLLFDLYHARANGQIVVGREDDEEFIYLVDGMPVQTWSRTPGPFALGNLLVNRGLVSADDRDKLVAEGRDLGRPLGEIAVSHGILSPHELFEILSAQLESKLLALFARTGAALRFEKGATTPHDAAPMHVDVAHIVLRGVRESVPAAEAIAHLEKCRECRLAWSGAPSEAAKLFVEPREARLLHLIDGERTVTEIVEDSRLDPGRAAQVIYVLWQLGMVYMSGL